MLKHINDKSNICVLILLYKTAVEDSETLKSILNLGDFWGGSIYIYDNTPDFQSLLNVNTLLSAMEEQGVGCKYIPLENKSISYVYNLFIAEVVEIYDFVAFFDQDTALTEDLVVGVKKALVSHGGKVDLILPRIRYRGKVISPTWRFFAKGWYCRPDINGIISRVPILALSAINSGMIVSSSYLLKYEFTYDERLKFYGTDDYFMEKFHKNLGVALIMDVTIDHDLSLCSLNGNSTDFKSRYFQMLDAWLVIYGSGVVSTMLIRTYMFIHCLVKSVRYCDSEYLNAGISYLFWRES